MSLFAKPPMFAGAVKTRPKLKPGIVSFEGKWQHVKKWIHELQADGWQLQTPITGQPDFKFTRVTLIRE